MHEDIRSYFAKIKNQEFVLNSQNYIFVLTFISAHSTIALWHNDVNRHCNAHTYSVCIVVEDHQVTVADIEAWQMVTGVLGIKYVFINHIGCSSCFRRVPSEKQGRAKHTESDYETSIFRVPQVWVRSICTLHEVTYLTYQSE